LPASGHGPLRQSEDRLIGGSRSAREGIVDRWRHATCWPFDQTSLSDHSVAELSPDLVSRLLPLERSIVDAADRSAVPVHSDLHRQHLLRDVAGDLTGVLDFGDAFIGSPVWDFALVRWYYGPANTTALATAYDGTDEHLVLAASHLALAVGLYKLAKSPDDSVVLDRLRVLLTSIDQVESI